MDELTNKHSNDTIGEWESIFAHVIDSLENAVDQLSLMPIKDYDKVWPIMKSLMYCHDTLNEITNTHIPYKVPEKKAIDTSDIPW